MAVIAGKHEIEIWVSEQTRSFYIDDCLIGTQRLLHSDNTEPLNIGSDEMVTINPTRRHRGRNQLASSVITSSNTQRRAWVRRRQLFD